MLRRGWAALSCLLGLALAGCGGEADRTGAALAPAPPPIPTSTARIQGRAEADISQARPLLSGQAAVVRLEASGTHAGDTGGSGVDHIYWSLDRPLELSLRANGADLTIEDLAGQVLSAGPSSVKLLPGLYRVVLRPLSGRDATVLLRLDPTATGSARLATSTEYNVLNFEGQDFTGYDFSISTAVSCTFVNCIFDDAAVFEMYDCMLKECRFDRAAFAGGMDLTSLVFCTGESTTLSTRMVVSSLITNCRFDGGNFSALDFVSSKLMDSSLVGANFQSSHFVKSPVAQECFLSGCDATRANFANTEFADMTPNFSIFAGANFSGASFSSVTMQLVKAPQANFTNTTWHGVSSTNMTLNGADFEGATFGPQTQFDFSVKFPNANARGANFRGVSTLNNPDWRGSDFSAAIAPNGVPYPDPYVLSGTSP